MPVCISQGWTDTRLYLHVGVMKMDMTTDYRSINLRKIDLRLPVFLNSGSRVNDGAIHVEQEAIECDLNRRRGEVRAHCIYDGSSHCAYNMVED